LSMKTVWEHDGRPQTMVSPLSLVISAFAPVTDIRRTLTPELRSDRGASELLLIDLGAGRNRLGGSALAQVYGVSGDTAPDVDDPALLRAFIAAIGELNRAGLLLAYHDRSDGGLLATLCEMAFAGGTGIAVNLPATASNALAALFSEELGAVVQVASVHHARVQAILQRFGLAEVSHTIGTLRGDGRIVVQCDGQTLVDEERCTLHRLWSATSYHMAALRDHPDCAREAYDAILEPQRSRLFSKPTFDPAAAPAIISKVRPVMAVLREQGVNGQLEMAAAFDRAGFDCIDVHSSDILEGRFTLDDAHALVACGGFSFGDVLGAGRGWANTILHHPRARDQFAAFFARSDTMALGVCNGCQMMSALKEIIPGADHWPQFVRNRSEQFEARLLMVEVLESPSIFMRGMAGSMLPLVVAHGEGRVQFARADDAAASTPVLRYIDGHGAPAARYPQNPNGSPDGLTAFCNHDGRFTIMMPHPERLFRNSQYSWSPDDWNGSAPWMRMFQNARAFFE